MTPNNPFALKSANQISSFVLSNHNFAKFATQRDGMVKNAATLVHAEFYDGDRFAREASTVPTTSSLFINNYKRSGPKHILAGLWGAFFGTAASCSINAGFNLIGDYAHNSSGKILKGTVGSFFGGIAGLFMGGAIGIKNVVRPQVEPQAISGGAAGLTSGITSAILLATGASIAAVALTALGIGLAAGVSGGVLFSLENSKHQRWQQETIVPTAERLEQLARDESFVIEFFNSHPRDLDSLLDDKSQVTTTVS